MDYNFFGHDTIGSRQKSSIYQQVEIVEFKFRRIP